MMYENKKKNFKKYPGYTLIELLVSIVVISIVFGVGYASFREFARRQALSGVTKKVLSDLRFAQQQALTGEKPTLGSCTVLEGYTFASSSDSYTVTANCSDGGTDQDTVMKTVSLEEDVGISSSSVQFKVLGQGTNLDSDLVITLTHAVSGNSSQITVGQGGEIK